MVQRDLSALLSKLPFKFDIPTQEPLNITLPDPKVDKLRKHFQSLSKEDQQQYLRRLNKDQWRYLYAHPDIFLFDKQVILGDEWMYYLLRCGRGFGKTHAGAAWVAKKIREGAKVIGLCGPTFDDVNKTMVPFILSWFLPDELEDPAYIKDDEVRFQNGARIYVYSSEIEKKGPNLEYLWCDEIATWCKGNPNRIKERYDDMVRSVRKGNKPQVVTTSTPKNHPFFTNFDKKVKDKHYNYKLVEGSLFDNPTLPESYILSQIEEHSHTSRGRQEIFGHLITETDGAYWTHPMIDDSRQTLPAPLVYGPQKNRPLTNDQLMGRTPIPTIDKTKPYLLRILIGFDPSGSVAGDECGIVIVALYSNKEAYVIEDCSGSYHPNQYAQLISDKYIQYQASAVVVETNFGGKDTFDYVLRSKNSMMKIIPTHSKQGKTTRAEHISALYSQGRVHHTATFHKLEDQMCQFNVDYSSSPDRLDALGFALQELFWPTDASGNKISIINIPSYK